MKTTKVKLPRDKAINPLEHEITLGSYFDVDFAGEDDTSVAYVSFKFAGTRGSMAVTKSEAATIGKWFTDVSKALK